MSDTRSSRSAARDDVPEGQRWSALMAKAQAGDKAAYVRLLGEISPYLRSLARRYVPTQDATEDAVQDILLTIHGIRHTYDPRLPFGPWLVTIAKRRLINRLRQHTRMVAHEVALEDDAVTFADDEVNLPDRKIHYLDVRKAVGELPDGQRQAVVLLKLREMSLKEASEASGQSIGALKVSCHRAIKALQRILEPSRKR
ncbi:sigma-70 family RNA polymerase sigma factor [Azospirillum sp. TSO22-1]|uniref:sigma-70 family RNA polymerase sigma factor n=1 Tax=Azospirillum sp. TSO22-1 TaxID=716789 RepID=UPI000D6147C0|nr:sigma-70 family RNA polymerase sigma factor [Azospirillum sp. TSO22-1]PWC40404.1 hypothetical protein TSO221_25540 [Azospirillum sp. TSO22-1]